jgi:2-oxoglutarate ferredoxin oxidoreductase subunit delta
MSEGFNTKGYHPPEVVKDGECVNCNLCEMICPDFAIYCVPAGSQAAAAAGRPVGAAAREEGPN